MKCDRARLALSADLDDEPLGVSPLSVHGHLAGCPACSGWYEAVTRITRTVRVTSAEPVPDLVPGVLAAALPMLAGTRRLTAARAALMLIALVQAVLAWPAVVLGQDGLTGMVHAAHETGAWNLALAVAFLGAATRPGTAGVLLRPLGTFVGVLAVSGALDVVSGAVTPQRLATHVVAAAGVALLVAVSRLSGPDQSAPGGRVRHRPAPGPAVPAGLVLVSSRPDPQLASARSVA